MRSWPPRTIRPRRSWPWEVHRRRWRRPPARLASLGLANRFMSSLNQVARAQRWRLGDRPHRRVGQLPDGPAGMSAPVLPRSYRRGGRGKRELPEGADPVFEEKLSKFLKTSEERLLDIKRNLEAKRGGRFK